MSVQPTSLEAYQYKIEPYLTEKQQAVLLIFKDHPNRTFTNAELAKKIGWPINNVTPRTLELRQMCMIHRVTRRTCKETKNNAYAMELLP